MPPAATASRRLQSTRPRRQIPPRAFATPEPGVPLDADALRAQWRKAFAAALAALRCAGVYLPPDELRDRAARLEAEHALTAVLLRALAASA